MARSRKDRDYDLPEKLRTRATSSHPREVKGLESAKLLAFTHDTFKVPPASVLKKLKPGDYVKVARNNERFWLRLTGYVGRRWHGRVSNNLKLNEDLKCGDPIYFMKRNIYDVLFADPEKMSAGRKKVLRDSGIHPWGHKPRV